MLTLLFNTLLTIIDHIMRKKKRRRKERTTYGPLRRYSRWVTHPVRNPDRQGLTWAPELKLNFSRRNSSFGGIFCLEYPSSRIKVGIILQRIVISQTTDFHFANYRFSFRKLQILISQSTDFHFAKYRFSFRKLQIFQFPFRFLFTSFRKLQ